MNKCTLLVIAVSAASFDLTAEVVDPYQEAFRDMFELVEHPYIPQGSMDEPPPPGVPLDGGLTALALMGGGLAYRRFKRSAAPKD